MDKIKKYWKVVVLVIASLVIGWAYGVTVSHAGGLKVFDTGVSVGADFNDFRATSMGNAKINHEGELDLNFMVIDWDAHATPWLNHDIEGNVGAYWRIYTVKGGSFEFLGGINQPIHSDDGFSDTRTISLRMRKPLK